MTELNYFEILLALVLLGLGSSLTGYAFFKRKEIFPSVAFEGYVLRVFTFIWTFGTLVTFVFFSIYLGLMLFILLLKGIS
jgi:hypothetical protein